MAAIAPVRLGAARPWFPSVEAGLRRDGGDVEARMGADVSGGVGSRVLRDFNGPD